MVLAVGSRLGHYTVTALIGEGGMGQVYQATDTKLNRQVALKILPEAFAADPDRLARFQREAQVLASLNHPGVAAIYGIEESEGTRALVLELVEGPTLADRIAQGPVPVDEALPIAKQIAEALEAAHEAGVIHRDLKPANIKVREDGTVKVLDFGLAKALNPSPESDPSQSPTLTAAATQMGVVMGTAAYMAPEQAKAKVADKRADVWAFGVVFYEMLTGSRGFDGADVSEVMAKVITLQPQWENLPPNLPPMLVTYLRRCLEKDPKDRVRDIGDVRLAITGAFDPPASASADVAHSSDSGVAVRARRWQRPLRDAMLAMALVAFTALAVWYALSPAPPRVVRLSVLDDQGASLFIAAQSPDIAMAPDGSHLAYVAGVGESFGAEELRVRRLDQLASEVVAEGDLNSPFFSPDGTSVGFYDRGGGSNQVMLRVSVLGGPVSTICDIPGGDMRGASWGPDGTIVFGTFDPNSGLWRVAAVGGEPEPLTAPDTAAGEVNHAWPEFLPDGNTVLFTIVASTPEESQIVSLSLDTGEQRIVLRGGSFPKYSSTGHLVYAADGNLWAVRFDANTSETAGDPVPVLEGVLTKSAGTANFGLSDTGSLVYVAGAVAVPQGDRTLVWVDRDGQEETIAAPTAPYEAPRVSPDGRYVAVESRGENTDVMVFDLERDTLTRLTFDPGQDRFPVWTPDGQRVLFASTRDGPQNVYSKAADGTGTVERVTTSDAAQAPSSWSPDGRALVITGGTAQSDLMLVDPDSTGPTESLTETEFAEFYPDVSPRGNWIAYTSDESGQLEVYVRPFPNLDDGRWQVSRNGGYSPVWGPGGRELFFRATGSMEMMVVPVQTDPTFTPGNPSILFNASGYRFGTIGRGRPWDVAGDGRFLMISGSGQMDTEDQSPPQVHVVLNWSEDLKRLAAAN